MTPPHLTKKKKKTVEGRRRIEKQRRRRRERKTTYCSPRSSATPSSFATAASRRRQTQPIASPLISYRQQGSNQEEKASSCFRSAVKNHTRASTLFSILFWRWNRRRQRHSSLPSCVSRAQVLGYSPGYSKSSSGGQFRVPTHLIVSTQQTALLISAKN